MGNIKTNSKTINSRKKAWNTNYRAKNSGLFLKLRLEMPQSKYVNKYH